MSEEQTSNFKVPYTTIVSIAPHPNADKLEIATIYAFQVVVKKGLYKAGDPVVYIPIDSVLSPWLEEKLFPMVKCPETGAWVKPPFALNKGRIRQVRIRKFASQGMTLDLSVAAEKVNFKKVKLEDDLAEALGITKYEPPVQGPARTVGRDKQRNKPDEHPLFHKYNGLTNIKWIAKPFEGQLVEVQEKLHGTNARASILPYRANTLWRKIKKFLGLAPKTENCYGSNNVDISSKQSYTGFYGEDVYGACFKKMDVFSKLKLGETVYGEIIGPGIQANYTYGLNEHKFVLFDVKVLKEDGSQEWLRPDAVRAFADERGFEMVPLVYYGEFDYDKIYAMTRGPSLYCPAQKVREGVVVKAVNEYSVQGNKQAYKWISEDYLSDQTNTDFH